MAVAVSGKTVAKKGLSSWFEHSKLKVRGEAVMAGYGQGFDLGFQLGLS